MNTEEVLEKIKDIPSNVKDADTEMHVKYLQDLPGKPLILDFGTGWGKLVCSIALACPQAEIYTFDPGTPYQDYEPQVRKYLADHVGERVHFEINDSYEHQWAKKVDVLSIDSSHTYEDTKHEVAKYFPLVKSPGLIFLHDYNVASVGVKQAVDEYLATHPGYEILDEGGYTTVVGKM